MLTDGGAGVSQCLVVMYHYVRDRYPFSHAGVVGLRCDEFRRQLDLLCRHLEPIGWPRLYAWLQGSASIPKRSFLLTFDDGLIEHSETVLPILNDYGLRGVFFVPGAILTERRMLPAHQVHLLLATVGEEALESEMFDRVRKYQPDMDIRACCPEATRMYHYESPKRARLKYLLTVKLPIEVRNAVLNDLFERYVGANAHWARRWYLNQDHLAAMKAAGHTVGAHGYAHEAYARLTPAEQEEDVSNSVAALNDASGMEVRPFSYPYGSVTGHAAKACRAAGFACAFSTEPALISASFDPFWLPRVDTINVDDVLRGTCHAI